MYYAMRASAPSLHREYTDSLILYTVTCTVGHVNNGMMPSLCVNLTSPWNTIDVQIHG